LEIDKQAPRIVVSSGGGKDSMLSLHRLLASQQFNVDSMIATVTEQYKRVSIHGIRLELMEQQAKSVRVPLRKVWIPKDCTNEEYQLRMGAELDKVRAGGIQHIMFGDIFLQDIKEYRDRLAAAYGLQGVYPIWQQNGPELIREFVRLGYKAIIVCVDCAKLSSDFLGRGIDEHLLNELPPDVDVCGENGEFHTFVYAGPIFNEPVNFKRGEEKIVSENGFTFAYLDLLPN
jgi:uncharacterized protein (TIGR00290 family)